MELTINQLALLRGALGISQYVKHPTRNWLPDAQAKKHPEDVAELIRVGCFKANVIHGPGGGETTIMITEKGKMLATGDQADGA